MFSLHSVVDRWSPVNPERQKQYDKEFLLEFQLPPEAVVKQPGLPEIPDIILDKVLIDIYL